MGAFFLLHLLVYLPMWPPPPPPVRPPPPKPPPLGAPPPPPPERGAPPLEMPPLRGLASILCQPRSLCCCDSIAPRLKPSNARPPLGCSTPWLPVIPVEGLRRG